MSVRVNNALVRKQNYIIKQSLDSSQHFCVREQTSTPVKWHNQGLESGFLSKREKGYTFRPYRTRGQMELMIKLKIAYHDYPKISSLRLSKQRKIDASSHEPYIINDENSQEREKQSDR